MKALVTGAGHGLGRAIAETILDKRGSVVALDQDRAALRTLEDEALGQVAIVPADLADPGGVERISEALAKKFRFDLVVLNAGISATGAFAHPPAAAYQKLLRVNVTAPLVMASRLVAGGAMNPGSTIVFVSSLSHVTGYPGASVYAASKDAVAAYAASVRKPFAKRGVRVLTVYPGPIQTDHAARHAPSGAKAERRMAPEKLARMILKSVRRKERDLYPGLGAQIAQNLGRLAPATMTRLMRRIIFEKLDRSVW